MEKRIKLLTLIVVGCGGRGRGCKNLKRRMYVQGLRRI